MLIHLSLKNGFYGYKGKWVELKKKSDNKLLKEITGSVNSLKQRQEVIESKLENISKSMVSKDQLSKLEMSNFNKSKIPINS